MKRSFTLLLLTLFMASLLVSCRTGTKKPKPIPLTKEEIAFLKKLEDPKTFSIKQETPVLFQNLGNLLTAWLESSLAKENPKHIRIYTDLGELLTRRVYVNFDTILDQLDNGPPPNKVIAAAALGFSRIPENPKFPQVYKRAETALLNVLDCGNDAIVENALLGLYNLGDPDTPLEKILDIMVQHHDPDVRANAALALQSIVTPAKADMVLPYLLPGLKDDEPKVRNHCILVALKLKEKSTLTALVDLLGDSYALIQANAAKAIGEIGDVTFCGSLIPKLKSRYPIVREYTLLSLKKLSGEDFGNDYDSWQKWWGKKDQSDSSRST